MKDTLSQKIIFVDSLKDYDAASIPDCAMHILCTEGSMSFNFHGTHYDIVAGDYVILPDIVFLSGLRQSDDYHAITMAVSASFVSTMDNRSNYGVIGHLLLMRNPVMKLSRHDFRICMEDLTRIRARLTMETEHIFREEMMGHLLMAHVLNLHDIHARGTTFARLSEHLSAQLQRFIKLLYDGEYKKSRSLRHYASLLFITPHYLSEICRLLCRKELTLYDIASELHFSSVSYFGRYVKKRLGMYPSEYRNMMSGRHKE